jgi:ABC-type Fe3+/spermidine/putrescine transport system ATPase subunit
MSRVIIQDLVKKYGTFTAVKGVSLDVAEGELVTLLGSSGCGKTTTLRCVAGLETPDGGEIFFDERPMSKVPTHLRSCGMVFQNYALFPHMTVEENLAYGLMAQRFRESGLLARIGLLMGSPLSCLQPEQRDRIGEALETVELAQHRAKKPGQLSGGQQQRVALARAMITSPRVLLFDEPLGALDAQLRLKMREEIRRIQRRAGITTLYVTHDQEEALAISDRIAVMNAGRIEQLGPPEEIYKRPRTRFIADFIGLENIFTGSVSGPGRALLEGKGIELAVAATLPGQRFTVALRPESLRFVTSSEGPNVLEGVVTLRMFMGTAVKYVVRVKEVDLTVMVPEQAAPDVAMDQPVRLQVAAEDILVMAESPAAPPPSDLDTRAMAAASA